jgi:hypothetical protein
MSADDEPPSLERRVPYASWCEDPEQWTITDLPPELEKVRDASAPRIPLDVLRRVANAVRKI